MNWVTVHVDTRAALARCSNCAKPYNSFMDVGLRHTHECPHCHHRYTRLELIRDDLKRRRHRNPHAVPVPVDTIYLCPCCEANMEPLRPIT